MSILIETVENGKEGSGNVPVEVLDHFNSWIWTIILCWRWPKLSSAHGNFLLIDMKNILLHDLTNLVMINHYMYTSESKPDIYFISKLMSILAWLWKWIYPNLIGVLNNQRNYSFFGVFFPLKKYFECHTLVLLQNYARCISFRYLFWFINGRIISWKLNLIWTLNMIF